MLGKRGLASQQLAVDAILTNRSLDEPSPVTFPRTGIIIEMRGQRSVTMASVILTTYGTNM